MIERTGKHLLAMINDVLDLSKIERGHLRLACAEFDLAALVASVGDLTRVSPAEKGLAVTLALALPSPCWVRADASRLRQLLLNLTGNAVKFTEHGGIDVTVRREPDGSTRFEVIGTGPGVAADQVEAIFDAFHQADATFGRRHGGIGLGLAISREVARTMGCDLACARSASAGTCFALTLPLPAARCPLALRSLRSLRQHEPHRRTGGPRGAATCWWPKTPRSTRSWRSRCCKSSASRSTWW